MKKIVLQLQVAKEVAEAQKVEITFLKKQLQEIEAKSEMLERELEVFRAKKQNSGQHPSKQASQKSGQPTTQRKSLKSLAEAVREEMHPISCNDVTCD